MDPNCRLCELHRTAQVVCCPGSGPEEAKVMIIGEAPAYRKYDVRENFSGQSGRLLRAELIKLGIMPGGCFITNAVKCFPGETDIAAKHIKACRNYLFEEINRVKPGTVLVLGNSAAQSIKGRKSKVIGTYETINNVTFYYTYHPGAILRDPGKLPAFRLHLKRFANLVNGYKPHTEDSFTLVDKSNINDMFLDVKSSKFWSFDIETNGLEWWLPSSKINLLQIATINNVWVIDAVKLRKYMPKVIENLAKISIKSIAIAQNGKFDNCWLSWIFGHKIHLGFDTMLAHYLINENDKHGLKYLSNYYLDAPQYDISLKDKIGKGDKNKLIHYAALDARYTLELYFILLNELVDEQQLFLFNELVMPVARIFTDIDCEGHLIDLDKFETTKFRYHNLIQSLTEELDQMAGKHINWNSPAQVGKVLFNELELTPGKLTPCGKPSTSEESLARLSHPIVDKLADYRACNKILSTYLDGWEMSDKDSNPPLYLDRLYLPTNLAGTVTGRHSSRLHQTPRGNIIRPLFIAPPGYVYAHADYSQVELRIVAHISQDEEMMNCFNNDIDIHLRTACEVLKLYPEEVTKEIRKKAKAVNFGFIYGMNSPKFRMYALVNYGLNISMEEAEDYRENYFNTFKAIPEWHRNQKKLVIKQGYVTTLTGRKRRLPHINSTDKKIKSEAIRQAINSPVQGFAGELKDMAIFDIYNTYDKSEVIIKGEVHDAILMYWREDLVDKLKDEIKSIMIKPSLIDKFKINLSVPLDVDIEIGKHWS